VEIFRGPTKYPACFISVAPISGVTKRPKGTIYKERRGNRRYG